MYAVINLPGSSHFALFGPASKGECATWLTATVRQRQRTELATSLLPQRILPNREVESWRFRDGTPVTIEAVGREALEDCPACGKPSWAPQHDSFCPRGTQETPYAP